MGPPPWDPDMPTIYPVCTPQDPRTSLERLRRGHTSNLSLKESPRSFRSFHGWVTSGLLASGYPDVRLI